MIKIGFSFGSIAGDLVGAVGGIASTVLGNSSAKNEAEKNRDFQEYMSNTSISRRMQDLRNAGLNPLLAVDNASSGASTPAGSQAQIERFNPAWLTALSSAKLQKEQSETQRAQTEQIKEQTKAIQQENSLFDIKKKQLEQESELQRQGILTEKTVQQLNNANSLEAKARILVHQANEKNIKMSVEEAKRKLQLLDLELDYYSQNPDAFSSEKVSNMYSSPTSALGAFLGSVNSAYQRWKNDNDKKVIKKDNVPRVINERRISR